MTFHRLAASGGAALTVLIVGTLPAAASNVREADWGRATVNTSNNTMTVTDKKCDGLQVYGKWHTVPGDIQTVRVTAGCGQSKTGGIPMGEGTEIEWTVCIDHRWPTPDDCTIWTYSTM